MAEQPRAKNAHEGEKSVLQFLFVRRSDVMNVRTAVSPRTVSSPGIILACWSLVLEQRSCPQWSDVTV